MRLIKAVENYSFRPSDTTHLQKLCLAGKRFTSQKNGCNLLPKFRGMNSHSDIQATVPIICKLISCYLENTISQ